MTPYPEIGISIFECPDFNWLPLIRAFAEAHAAEADTVTVLWDQESTGHNEYLTDEAGRTLDHIPLQEIVQ